MTEKDLPLSAPEIGAILSFMADARILIRVVIPGSRLKQPLSNGHYRDKNMNNVKLIVIPNRNKAII